MSHCYPVTPTVYTCVNISVLHRYFGGSYACVLPCIVIVMYLYVFVLSQYTASESLYEYISVTNKLMLPRYNPCVLHYLIR